MGNRPGIPLGRVKEPAKRQKLHRTDDEVCPSPLKTVEFCRLPPELDGLPAAPGNAPLGYRPRESYVKKFFEELLEANE